MERYIIEGKVKGKRKGRPLTLWANGIVKWLEEVELMLEKGGVFL